MTIPRAALTSRAMLADRDDRSGDDPAAPIGVLMRAWRERRRLSQMELALDLGISTRHLSFIETGRSRPSRAMILRLAEGLDVPLRTRNDLLLAAGFAPVYAQTPLDAPRMARVHAAIRQVLDAHAYPAAAVDRHWNLVAANAGVALLTAGSAPALLSPPVNVLRVSLHPDGMAPRIVNLGEWRAHLLGRLHSQVIRTADPTLADLYRELRAYPCDQIEPAVELPGPGDIFVPLRIRHEGREIAFFSMMTVFSTPLDLTLAELAIEAFFPANAETVSLLRTAVQDAP